MFSCTFGQNLAFQKHPTELKEIIVIIALIRKASSQSSLSPHQLDHRGLIVQIFFIVEKVSYDSTKFQNDKNQTTIL